MVLLKTRASEIPKKFWLVSPQAVELTPTPNVQVSFSSWNFYLKNLSSVSFLSTSWSTGLEWQVKDPYPDHHGSCIKSMTL